MDTQLTFVSYVFNQEVMLSVKLLSIKVHTAPANLRKIPSLLFQRRYRMAQAHFRHLATGHSSFQIKTQEIVLSIIVNCLTRQLVLLNTFLMELQLI